MFDNLAVTIETPVLVAIGSIVLIPLIMGLFLRKPHFAVAGKTVLITGGSQGMGRAVAVLLASKGANVIIAARNAARLDAALAQIKAAAAKPDQRFVAIPVDLTSAESCTDMINYAAHWNNGSPPDVVWCCAGSSTPTLFIDTPPEVLRAQMDSNYFTAAFTAQAALRAWLRPAPSAPAPSDDPRHLIFTSSFVGLFAIAGYAPYTPSKTALRGLADSLAMEMQLYAGAAAAPDSPRKTPEIKIHTVYPATIYSESFEHEQQVKSDMTKKLEEGDSGQTPAQVAAAAVKGLERGQELISTTLLTRMVAGSVLGGSRGIGLADRVISWVMNGLGIMTFVRGDLDTKTRRFGTEHGDSGMKASSGAKPASS